MSSTTPFNPFTPAKEDESRSPCPALNALANHSYIPHDGRSIPFFTLVHALRTIYKFSVPLAYILAIGGFILCGHFTGSGLSTRLSLDLHDLARHGRIEHDGSLAHADTAEGDKFAPTVPDPRLIAQLLDSRTDSTPVPPKANGSVLSGTLNLFDVARARFLRDRALSRPLDAVHAEIARGESALLLRTFADAHGELSRAHVAQWLSEERLPEGWTGPHEQISLLGAAKLGRQVGSEVARLQRYT